MLSYEYLSFATVFRELKNIGELSIANNALKRHHITGVHADSSSHSGVHVDSSSHHWCPCRLVITSWRLSTVTRIFAAFNTGLQAWPRQAPELLWFETSLSGRELPAHVPVTVSTLSHSPRVAATYKTGLPHCIVHFVGSYTLRQPMLHVRKYQINKLHSTSNPALFEVSFGNIPQTD